MIFDLQKASLLKRLSAFILDIILVSVLAVGFAFCISLITNYDQKNNQLQNYYAQYEAEYGVKLDIDQQSYNELPEGDKQRYDEAYQALIEDKDVLKTYNLVINLTLVMVTSGLFLAYLVFYFILPLIFKNGQTIGMKIFGICIMRTNGVKVNGVCMFIRAILGQFTIETMIPTYIIIMIINNQIGIAGGLVLILLPLLQLVLLLTTKRKQIIHDILSDTVMVDMASQRIFDSEKELIEYQKKCAFEKAQDSAY